MGQHVVQLQVHTAKWAASLIARSGGGAGPSRMWPSCRGTQQSGQQAQLRGQAKGLAPRPCGPAVHAAHLHRGDLIGIGLCTRSSLLWRWVDGDGDGVAATGEQLLDWKHMLPAGQPFYHFNWHARCLILLTCEGAAQNCSLQEAGGAQVVLWSCHGLIAYKWTCHIHMC